MMHVNWDNIVVTGISGIKIDMLTEAKVSIFTDNDLTHINDDHFEINLVAHLLNQIYVVPLPPPRYDYDDPHANLMDELTPCTPAGVTASGPPVYLQHDVFYIYHLKIQFCMDLYDYMHGLMISYLHMFYTLLE